MKKRVREREREKESKRERWRKGEGKRDKVKERDRGRESERASDGVLSPVRLPVGRGRTGIMCAGAICTPFMSGQSVEEMSVLHRRPSTLSPTWRSGTLALSHQTPQPRRTRRQSLPHVWSS